MTGDIKTLLSGAGLSLMLRLLGAGTQFVFSILIARFYGAEGLGIYALALSFVVIASTLGRWGLDQASLKYISIYAEKEEWQNVKVVQQRALTFVTMISLLLMFILLAISEWFVTLLFDQPGLNDFLFVLALSLVPLSGLNLLAECMRAVKRVGAYTLIQSVLVAALAVLGVLFFHTLEYKVLSAAYAYVFACYVTFFVALFLWWRFIRLRSESKHSQSKIKLFETASPMAWVAIVTTLMSFSETLLLGLFQESEEIGIYSAALRLALLMSFILIAFNSVLAPRFASFIHNNQMEKVQSLARKSVVLMLLAALPLSLIFMLFAENILQLFGQDFGRGATCLIILAFAQLINVITGPVSLLLMMGGFEKEMRKLSVYAWLIGLSTGLYLIPLYGAEGAAVSAFVGIVLLNSFAVFSVKKHMNIRIMSIT